MKHMILPVLALTPLLAAASDDLVVVTNVTGLVTALGSRGADAEPLEVVVSPGEYVLSSPLVIDPDTTLTLMEGAVLRAGFADGPMLRGRHYAEDGSVCSGQASCTHGGYGQTHDVVVQGGVWDRDSPADVVTSVFSFRHSSGMVVRDTTVLNCSGHYFNFSGSENVSISNVVFSAPVPYTATDKSFWGSFEVGDPLRYQTIEAIHVDFINEVGEPSVYPQDGTGCRNIFVDDCLFDGVFSGVGTHHKNDEAQGDGLYVTDCVFSNLLSWAVFAYSLDSVQIEDCTVVGGAGLITALDAEVSLGNNFCADATDHAVRVEDSSLDASGNTIADCAGHAFQVVSSEALLEDNVVDAPANVGIRGSSGSTIQANRNRILDAGLHAISIAEGTVLSATGNVIERPAQCAVLVNAAKVTKLSGNTFKNAGASAVGVMSGATVSMSGNSIVSPAVHGVVVTGKSTLTASNNTVSDAASNAFNVNASTAKLTKNTVLRPKGVGIRGADSAVIVADSNTVKNAATYGILMTATSKLTAKSNTIESSGAHGIMVDGCQASSITGNKVVSSAKCGIKIVKTKGCTVSSNTVSKTGSKSDGIVLENCATGTVSGNKVSGTAGYGIRVFGSKAIPVTVAVKSNNVSSGGTASGYADIRLGDYCKNCTVTGNLIAHRKFTSSTTGTSGTVYKPAGSSLSSAVRKSATALSVGWTGRDCVNGYEIQYADNTSFKSAKTKKISGAKTVSASIGSLASGKRYWARVRTFDNVTGKTVYSGWSAAVPVLHSWAVGTFSGRAIVDGIPCTVDATVAVDGKVSGTIKGKGVSASFSASGFSSYDAKKTSYKFSFSVTARSKKRTCTLTLSPVSGLSSCGRMLGSGTGISFDLSRRANLTGSPLKKLVGTERKFGSSAKNSGIPAGKALKLKFASGDVVSLALSAGGVDTALPSSRLCFYKAAKSGTNTVYNGQIPIIAPDAGLQRNLKFTITRKQDGTCTVNYAFAAF